MKNLLILLPVLFIFACSKDSQPDISQSRNDGLLPLALGNTWIFADSSWNNGVLASAGYDTLFVEKIEKWNDDTCYYFNREFSLAVSGDTIYGLRAGWSGFFREPEFFPVTKDTITDISLYGGDVAFERISFSLDKVISVPAGSFSPCNYYSMKWFRTIILSPETGFVKIIETDGYGPEPPNENSGYRRVRSLIKVSLKQS